MKPLYLTKDLVPEEIINKLLNEENGEQQLHKLIEREVLMEQELATSTDKIKVSDYIKRIETY